MERGPRGVPVYSSPSGLEETDNHRAQPCRPKSAKARPRARHLQPDLHSHQQVLLGNVVNQQHAEMALSEGAALERCSARTGSPDAVFRHCRRDRQGEASVPKDPGGVRAPAVRPTSARGRRQQHPEEEESHTQNLRVNQHDLSEGTAPHRSGGGPACLTGPPRVSEDARRAAAPLDQDHPEVEGQVTRPKSSKGRQRPPIQPRPQSRRQQRPTPDAQSQESHLSVEDTRRPRYQHQNRRTPTPAQAQGRDRRTARTPNEDGKVYSQTEVHARHAPSSPTASALPVPGGSSPLNRYCVLPSIRPRHTESPPKQHGSGQLH